MIVIKGRAKNNYTAEGLDIKKDEIYSILDYKIEREPIWAHGNRVAWSILSCFYHLEHNEKRIFINIDYELFEILD